MTPTIMAYQAWRTSTSQIYRYKVLNNSEAVFYQHQLKACMVHPPWCHKCQSSVRKTWRWRWRKRVKSKDTWKQEIYIWKDKKTIIMPSSMLMRYGWRETNTERRREWVKGLRRRRIGLNEIILKLLWSMMLLEMSETMFEVCKLNKINTARI
jgi:hypothetical protein